MFIYRPPPPVHTPASKKRRPAGGRQQGAVKDLWGGKDDKGGYGKSQCPSPWNKEMRL